MCVDCVVRSSIHQSSIRLIGITDWQISISFTMSRDQRNAKVTCLQIVENGWRFRRRSTKQRRRAAMRIASKKFDLKFGVNNKKWRSNQLSDASTVPRWASIWMCVYKTIIFRMEQYITEYCVVNPLDNG